MIIKSCFPPLETVEDYTDLNQQWPENPTLVGLFSKKSTNTNKNLAMQMRLRILNFLEYKIDNTTTNNQHEILF
jgi:hypothetical protein